jgi:hypothetical protein
VHDLATTLLSFGLNLSSVPIVPSLLEKLVEAMSVTLLEMHATKSSFLDELKTFADPSVPTASLREAPHSWIEPLR